MSLHKHKLKKITNTVIANNILSRNRLVNIFNRYKNSKYQREINRLRGNLDKLSEETNKYLLEKRELDIKIENLRVNIMDIKDNLEVLEEEDNKLLKRDYNCKNISKHNHSYRNPFGKVIHNFTKFRIMNKSEYVSLKSGDIIGFYNGNNSENICWYLGQIVENRGDYLLLDVGPGENIYKFYYKSLENYPGSLLVNDN